MHLTAEAEIGGVRVRGDRLAAPEVVPLPEADHVLPQVVRVDRGVVAERLLDPLRPLGRPVGEVVGRARLGVQVEELGHDLRRYLGVHEHGGRQVVLLTPENPLQLVYGKNGKTSGDAAPLFAFSSLPFGGGWMFVGFGSSSSICSCRDRIERFERHVRIVRGRPVMRWKRSCELSMVTFCVTGVRACRCPGRAW